MDATPSPPPTVSAGRAADPHLAMSPAIDAIVSSHGNFPLASFQSSVFDNALAALNVGAARNLDQFVSTVLPGMMPVLEARLRTPLAEVAHALTVQASVLHSEHVANMMRPVMENFRSSFVPSSAVAAQLAIFQERSGAMASLAAANLFESAQLSEVAASIARIATEHADAFRSPFFGNGMLAYVAAQSATVGSKAYENSHSARVRPAAALDSYIHSLGVRPTERRARVAGLAGHGVAGILVGDALMTPGLGFDHKEQLECDSQRDVLEPWVEGQDAFRADLYDALAGVHPMLPEYLKGAWADIHVDGPAAVSKVANCLTEALDLFLRTLAEPGAVLSWLGENELSGGQYVHNSQPTRAAKIAYIVRSRSRRDRGLLNSVAKSLTSRVTDVRGDIERLKHGGQLVTVEQTIIRVHAQSVESLLAEILFGL